MLINLFNRGEGIFIAFPLFYLGGGGRVGFSILNVPEYQLDREYT